MQDEQKLNLKSANKSKSFNNVYRLMANRSWQHVGYICNRCDKMFKTTERSDSHEKICKKINTTSTSKEKEMPIQVITIKGERYYRWGDHGKAYKNRADAEKQAQAAYASGYKKPQEPQKKM